MRIRILIGTTVVRIASAVGEMLEELQWPELQERRQQASLIFFYKIHKNLVTTDKTEAGGNREYQIPPLFLSSPGQYQLEMDLLSKLSLLRQLIGLSAKCNDLGLCMDMAWYACPWGLLANSFNWGGFVKDFYCYLFLVFFLSNLCATPTPAIMVKHDWVRYREKEKKKQCTETEILYCTGTED